MNFISTRQPAPLLRGRPLLRGPRRRGRAGRRRQDDRQGRGACDQAVQDRRGEAESDWGLMRCLHLLRAGEDVLEKAANGRLLL